MRKVIVSNLVSLDGYYAGPNGEIDWFTGLADKEFESYAIDLISTADTMLFGRVTYELMASYWPTATPATDDPRIIDAMNSFPKVVFSKTLEKVEWTNSRLVKSDVAEEVLRLKQLPASPSGGSVKNMVIYGSGTIVSALAHKNLIDDYRIFVCPTILGGGQPLFKDIVDRIHLRLLETTRFGTGMVALHYLSDQK